MSEVTQDLKPCPFCGYDGGFEVEGDDRATSASTVTIFCNGCHASAATEHSYVAAAARWNTRPPAATESPHLAQIAKLTEALEELLLLADPDVSDTAIVVGNGAPALLRKLRALTKVSSHVG